MKALVISVAVGVIRDRDGLGHVRGGPAVPLVAGGFSELLGEEDAFVPDQRVHILSVGAHG